FEKVIPLCPAEVLLAEGHQPVTRRSTDSFQPNAEDVDGNLVDDIRLVLVSGDRHADDVPDRVFERVVHGRDLNLGLRRPDALGESRAHHPRSFRFQRACAALRASARRSAGVSMDMRALPPFGPPFLPPIRPRARKASRAARSSFMTRAE